MFEVCKVRDRDAVILTRMSEVCIRGPIKSTFSRIKTAHPSRRRNLHCNYDNYATIHYILRTKKPCLNVCKVRENMPPFAGNADDAHRSAHSGVSELVELVQHCLQGGAIYQKS